MIKERTKKQNQWDKYRHQIYHDIKDQSTKITGKEKPEVKKKK